MSNLAKNPYIAGKPVVAEEMFFGRQDIFDFVRLNLIGRYQDNAIVLYGNRRTGKTSVLKQMHHHLAQTHLCVFIDLEGMALDGIGSFLWYVADAIWRALDAEGIACMHPEWAEYTSANEPRNHFSEVFLSQVGDLLGDRRILLMFDEAMELQRGVQEGKLESDVFPYLSHLLQHYPVVNFIFCIRDRPREIDREFSQAFRAALFKEISFLERDAAFDLITRPVRSQFEYSETAMDAIYRLTSGHPYFIQMICHSLYNRWQTEPRKRLELTDVNAVLEEVTLAASSHLRNMWQDLGADEKVILAALAAIMSRQQEPTRDAVARILAENHVPQATGEVMSALQTLANKSLIFPDAPYSFRVDCFRAWIQANEKIEWVQDEVRQQIRAAEQEITKHREEVRLRYLRQVQDKCKWLDFRGLILSPELFFLRLPDMYVPLHVTVARHEDLFMHLAQRAQARYLAEELASSGSEMSLAVRRELADEMHRLAAAVERARVDIGEALWQYPRLVILGDPGSGKTTFLRFLALTFAEGRETARERFGIDADWLPILVPIDAYAAALRAEPDLALSDYMPRLFASREIELPELSAYFRQELAAGRCLVLLDGLDTVLDTDERHRVVRHVDAFVNHSAANRFVVTSRIEGYSETRLQGDYRECTAADLEMPEIERFAGQWSLACEIQVADTVARRAWAEVQASRLIEAIKAAPGVRRLAGNPLLLTMVALIHRQGRLPRHRVALYFECARTLNERWNLVRSINMQPVGLPMDATEAFRNFGPLALWMHEEKRRGTVSGEELQAKIQDLLIERGLPEQDAHTAAHTFLDMERNQIGLLVERGVNAFGFSHLTFQEYYAARAVVANRRQMVDKLRAHLHDPRWREVVLLAAGQIGAQYGEEDAVTELVEAIADSHSPYEEVLHRDLLLAGRCLADDVGISYQTRSRLLGQLLDLWHSATFDRLQREISDTLAAMRGTACEPQVLKALMDDLGSEDAARREIAAGALGRMGMTSDAVLDALVFALRNDSNATVRSNSALALGRLNVAPERVARALDDAQRLDDSFDVRLQVAEALAYIGRDNEMAVQMLLSALNDPEGNVRGSAAAALKNLQHPSENMVKELLQALRDTRVDVRTNAAEILGRLGQHSAQVIIGLTQVLEDGKEDARVSAAMALGEIGDTSDQVVKVLIRHLGDESRVVRKNVAAALGKLAVNADDVVVALRAAVANDATRVGAADALGQAGRADASMTLVMAMQFNASNWQDRIQAVEALVHLDREGNNSNLVIDTLADVLKEERRMRWDVITGAAITLSEVARRSSTALNMVVNLLEHESWVVRAAAAAALGRSERPTADVINALIQTIQEDKDDHTRGNAATALGNLGISNDTVIDILVDKLSDFHGYVRVAAADALAKLGVRGIEKIPIGLIGLLDDGYYSHFHDRTVRDAAFDALWSLAPYSSMELRR